MGFGDNWIAWIKGIVTSARVSVIVNGSPTKQFQMEKGVRQGDPLSPFLFILAMEGLVAAMKEAMEKGLFRGIALPNGGPQFSNLHFADDVVFLGVWNDRNIRNLMRILRWFHAASGLSINWGKSTLTGIKVPSVDVARKGSALGCKIGKFPLSYLGLPIGSSTNKAGHWSCLLDKFSKKLSAWKANILSFGGKLTLIKSVLGNLGDYLFSLYKAPSKVVKKLETMRKDFFWGSKENMVRIPWVAWDVVLNSHEKGGLGIGSLQALNVALLAKWWWRYRLEDSALWRKVIDAIHDVHGCSSYSGHTSNRGSPWLNIVNIEKVVAKANLSLNSLFTKSIGNGFNTHFWLDSWCDSSPLVERFPRLTALDADRNCKVADRVTAAVHRLVFHWNWRRCLREGRETRDFNMLISLCSVVPITTSSESWAWSLKSSDVYSVNSLRKAFDDMTLRRGKCSTIWIKNVPAKVSIPFWRIRMNMLPTKDNLLRKGVALVDDICPWCQECPENREHIFVTCRKSAEVRNVINMWWKVLDSNDNNFDDLLIRRSDVSENKRTKVCKEVVLNAAIFSNTPLNTWRAANEVQSYAYLWVHNRCFFGKSINWVDWCCNLNLLGIWDLYGDLTNPGKVFTGKMLTTSGIVNAIQIQALIWLNVRSRMGKEICWDDWLKDPIGALVNGSMQMLRIWSKFIGASGLEVNFHKSKGMGTGVKPEDISATRRVLTVLVSGHAGGAKMSKITSWLSLIEKFHNKLLSWKAKTYKEVIKILESIRAPFFSFLFFFFFFFGGGVDKAKISWVAWNATINNIKHGVWGWARDQQP
ncbi:hypothetical protein OSB04_001817 [Centaurea solstitialis]|uniref:Reverse transcriptase domain-containing protein n=1 Tax=Centaurea solstitialis TaxID=347529 RepID=A0AA38WV32_9ASTR|nr:hypothetical protein OSB04_001817 [Centaurea solstitialis]